MWFVNFFFFFFQAEDGIRDKLVTGVQTCALPISSSLQEQSIITVPDLIDRHFKGVNRDQVDRLFLILPFLAPHQELTRGDKGAGDIESFFENVAARSFHGQMPSQTLMPLL